LRFRFNPTLIQNEFPSKFSSHFFDFVMNEILQHKMSYYLQQNINKE